MIHAQRLPPFDSSFYCSPFIIPPHLLLLIHSSIYTVSLCVSACQCFHEYSCLLSGCYLALGATRREAQHGLRRISFVFINLRRGSEFKVCRCQACAGTAGCQFKTFSLTPARSKCPLFLRCPLLFEMAWSDFQSPDAQMKCCTAMTWKNISWEI